MEDKKEFKPFIPADRVVPELTVTSIIIGALLAVLFGGANAYLGAAGRHDRIGFDSCRSYFHGYYPRYFETGFYSGKQHGADHRICR